MSRRKRPNNITPDIEEFAKALADNPQEYRKGDSESFQQNFKNYADPEDDEDDVDDKGHVGGDHSDTGENPNTGRTGEAVNSHLIAATLSYFIAIICSILIDAALCIYNKRESGTYALSQQTIAETGQHFSQMFIDAGLSDFNVPGPLRILMTWAKDENAKKGIQDSIKTATQKPNGKKEDNEDKA